MGDDRRSWLAYHMKEKTYTNGKEILSEGSISPYLMFVMEGAVCLSKKTQASKQQLTTLAVGSIFGALSIIAASAPSFKHAAKELSRETSSAVTVGNTRILHLPKVHYDKVIHSGYKTVDKIWNIVQERAEAHNS